MSNRVISRRPARTPAQQRGCPPASAVLGDDHPVARAARTRHALAWQLAVTSGLVAASAADVLARGGAAIELLSSAAVVELGLVGVFAFASSRLHKRARDVIADCGHRIAAAEIDSERTRLASRRHREQLARSLERALYAAEHWHQLSITSRPPPTVRALCGCSKAARDVTSLVRDPRTAVRGVALLDRLVCGGCSSALYAGRPGTLADELGRIRFLLQVPSGGR